jgi:hypothetical protein
LIEFAEDDLVAPHLAQKIGEYVNRQLLAGAAAIAETKWRESRIIACRRLIHRLLQMF